MTPMNISGRKLDPVAAFYTACICVLFGANAVAIKISVGEMGPFTAAAIRFSLAACALWLWAKASKQRVSSGKKRLFRFFLLSLIFTAQESLFYLGISRTYASRGALLANFQPFFVLILAHYWIPRDRITVKNILGILLGFSGVAFVFLESKTIAVGFRTGDLMMLSSAFCWALNGVYAKRIVSEFEPYELVLFPMALSVPFFVAQAWLWDPAMTMRLNLRILSAMTYQSLVCTAFGFVAWIHLLRRYGAVSVHSFIFLIPVAGVLLAGLLLDEPITLKILLALVLVAAGIITVQLKEKAPEPFVPPGKSL